MTTQTAWLIEITRPRVLNIPTYWGYAGPGRLDWVVDDQMAIRYSRKLDALRVIDSLGLGYNIEAVQHNWSGENNGK